MTRWAYRVTWGPRVSTNRYNNLFEQPELANWLNEMGGEGWEVVKLDHVTPVGVGALRGAFGSDLQWVAVVKRLAGETERL